MTGVTKSLLEARKSWRRWWCDDISLLFGSMLYGLEILLLAALWSDRESGIHILFRREVHEFDWNTESFETSTSQLRTDRRARLCCWKTEEDCCACVGRFIVQAELPLPLEPADRSVPVTCAARDSHTNELKLSLWRARGSLCFSKQMHCTIKKPNTWRKLRRGHMLKSRLLPGGMAAAAGEEQARTQYHSAASQHTPDLVFPTGTGVARLVWTLGQCRLLVGSSVPSQAYRHSYSCDFALAMPTSLPEHQICYLPVLPSVHWGVGVCLYTVLWTFPKEFYGAKGSYCSHSKFYRLWKDLGLNVLCQSKNGQPLPTRLRLFVSTGPLEACHWKLTQMVSLFWLFLCFILCNFKLPDISCQ